MERSKITAIITGVIALILSITYLVVVQLLDLRGEMVPAPVDDLAMVFGPASTIVFTLQTLLPMA